ncbi:hypothetical protein CPC08DRAFT_145404 [Agrocybe pediades]|nr:hypothetical protein CPC08DRAFT_145404 [Agrocybe pediades]
MFFVVSISFFLSISVCPSLSSILYDLGLFSTTMSICLFCAFISMHFFAFIVCVCLCFVLFPVFFFPLF